MADSDSSTEEINDDLSQSTLLSSESDSEENVYEVEKIVTMKIVQDKPMYLVRWVGYSADHDTWEPKENLENCESMIDAFIAKQEQTKAKQNERTPQRAETIRKKRNKRPTYYYISTSDEEANTLKDTFWRDLEHGKINVFGTDMYDKVKGPTRPAKPQTFKKSSSTVPEVDNRPRKRTRPTPESNRNKPTKRKLRKKDNGTMQAIYKEISTDEDVTGSDLPNWPGMDSSTESLENEKPDENSKMEVSSSSGANLNSTVVTSEHSVDIKPEIIGEVKVLPHDVDIVRNAIRMDEDDKDIVQIDLPEFIASDLNEQAKANPSGQQFTTEAIQKSDVEKTSSDLGSNTVMKGSTAIKSSSSHKKHSKESTAARKSSTDGDRGKVRRSSTECKSDVYKSTAEHKSVRKLSMDNEQSNVKKSVAEDDSLGVRRLSSESNSNSSKRYSGDGEKSARSIFDTLNVDLMEATNTKQNLNDKKATKDTSKGAIKTKTGSANKSTKKLTPSSTNPMELDLKTCAISIPRTKLKNVDPDMPKLQKIETVFVAKLPGSVDVSPDVMQPPVISLNCSPASGIESESTEDKKFVGNKSSPDSNPNVQSTKLKAKVSPQNHKSTVAETPKLPDLKRKDSVVKSSDKKTKGKTGLVKTKDSSTNILATKAASVKVTDAAVNNEAKVSKDQKAIGLMASECTVEVEKLGTNTSFPKQAGCKADVSSKPQVPKKHSIHKSHSSEKKSEKIPEKRASQDSFDAKPSIAVKVVNEDHAEAKVKNTTCSSSASGHKSHSSEKKSEKIPEKRVSQDSFDAKPSIAVKVVNEEHAEAKVKSTTCSSSASGKLDGKRVSSQSETLQVKKKIKKSNTDEGGNAQSDKKKSSHSTIKLTSEKTHEAKLDILPVGAVADTSTKGKKKKVPTATLR